MSATLFAPSANGVHPADDVETREWRARLLTGDLATDAEPAEATEPDDFFASKVLSPDEAVISCLIRKPSLLPECDLSPDDFRDARCSRLFRELRAMLDEGTAIDLVSLGGSLARFDELGADLGAEYLGTLFNGFSIPANFNVYCRQVAEAAAARKETQRLDRLRHEIATARIPQDISDAIVAYQTTASPSPAPRAIIQTVTSAELAGGRFDRRWLIDNIIVADEPLVIAGEMKSLNTAIAIDLALSLSTATHFLGKYDVAAKANVGLISRESGAATIQETARRIAAAKGVELAKCDGMVWSFDLRNLCDRKHLDALSDFIAENALTVVILDPFYLCLGEGVEGSNLFQMGDRLRRLSDVVRNHGCTLVNIHHFKRGRLNRNAEPSLSDIAFSGMAEHCRQFILLDRRMPYSGERTGRHELKLVAGGSAGHSLAVAVDIEEGRLSDLGGRRWEVMVQSLASAQSEAIEAKAKIKSRADPKLIARQSLGSGHRRHF